MLLGLLAMQPGSFSKDVRLAESPALAVLLKDELAL